jgi:hypothetical protein
MDAVRRERRKAYSYGYLRSNPRIVVTDGPYLAITPVNPEYVVVPYYTARWGRTWVNRGVYSHPAYASIRRYSPAPAYRPGPEGHELRPRSEPERKAWQNGNTRREEQYQAQSEWVHRRLSAV